MAMRRESGRASGTGGRKTPPKTKRAQPQRQSSLGSNAAAAHGYTQKGPTRKLKRAPKPKPAPRTPLRTAYQRDVAEENQKGSPAQRGAAIRRQNEYEAKARTKAPREAAQQRVTLKRRDAAAKKSDSGLVKRLVAVAEGAAAANPITAPLVGPKPSALDRELSGKGKVTKLIAKGAKAATRNGVVVSTGAGPNIAGRASAAGKRPKGGAVIAAATPKAVKSPELLNRGVEDVLNLPGTALPSLYVPAHAAVKAATGDTSEAKKYVADVKHTDPIYNTVAAGVSAATGDTKGAKRHLRLAKQSASEHPGLAALEVIGAKGAIGRGAGRLIRGTGKTMKAAGAVKAGERVHRVAATDTRPAAVEPGTKLSERRVYSRDITTKGAQVLRDRAKTRKAVKLRKQAATAKTEDVRTRKLEQANEADPRIMSDRAIKERVDLQEARSETRRRHEVQEAGNTAHKLIKDSRDKGAALNLVTQGITKASVKDLRAYRDELARTHATLEDAGKKRANRQLRELIDKSINRAQNGRIRSLDMERVKDAAQKFSEQVDVPIDKELVDLGLIPAERAARTKLIPAAARGATAADRDVPPSYISQAPSSKGLRGYYQSTSREPVISSRQRTTRPTVEGTFNAEPETLRNRAMKGKGIAVAAREFRTRIDELAATREDGKVWKGTRDAADKRAASIKAQTGRDFTPVQYEPWGATKGQREAMAKALDDTDSPAAEKGLVESMKRAFDKDQTDGAFVLVPETAARRMQGHLNVTDSSDIGKVMQALRGQFSKTVLSTSPGPMIGNVVESGFRGAAHRAGPTSYITGKRVLRAMKPEDRQSFEDMAIPGGRVVLATTTRHFQPDQLAPGSLRKMTAAMGSVTHKAPVKQASWAWQQWTHFVNGYINGKVLEKNTQTAMLGKAIRDSGLMGDGIVRLSSKAVQQAADGLTGTAEQAAFAKQIQRMYGQYSAFGPGQRKLIAQYTPFLAWTINSAKFLGRMPFDQPTLTALLVINQRATKEWRQAAGVGAEPLWLRGDIPTGGKRYRVTRNTPLGIATDPLGNLAGLWMPQFSGIIQNAGGHDWKGDKLRNSDGSDYSTQQRLGVILDTFAQASIPAYAVPKKGIGYAKAPKKLISAARIDSSKGNSTGKLVKSKPAADDGFVDLGDVDLGDGGGVDLGDLSLP